MFRKNRRKSLQSKAVMEQGILQNFWIPALRRIAARLRLGFRPEATMEARGGSTRSRRFLAPMGALPYPDVFNGLPRRRRAPVQALF